MFKHSVILVLLTFFAQYFCVAIEHSVHPLILGGNEAIPGQFPFQVSIKKKTITPQHRIFYDHICSGSIISDEWIITVSRCIFGIRPDLIAFFVGAHRKDNDGVKHEIDRALVHPEYRGMETHMIHDIALLKSMETISFSKIVQPIGILLSEIDDRLPGQVSGWGMDRYPEVGWFTKRKIP